MTLTRTLKLKHQEICRSEHANHWSCVNLRRRQLQSRNLHEEAIFYSGMTLNPEDLDQNLNWYLDYYQDFEARGDSAFITTIDDLLA